MRTQTIKNSIDTKQIDINDYRLYSVGNTDSIMKHNLPKLSDFDEIEFLQVKKESYYLVKLVRNNVISFGYLMMKIKGA
jgi:hypothetical protein